MSRLFAERAGDRCARERRLSRIRIGRGRIESTPIIDGMRFLLASFMLTRLTASAPRRADISPDTSSTSLRNRTLGVDRPGGVERAADGDRATYFQIAVYGQRPMHRKRPMKRIVSTAFAWGLTVGGMPFDRGRRDRAAGGDVAGYRQRTVDSYRPEDDERPIDVQRPRDDRLCVG
ncbi:hypothetical protein KTD19_20505 [Burkholderia multivorans]|uniref:hypothetical protein n=1 Tax=Burkholderia multivorans TaxID=87883 RepID=UPI0012DDC138|nr:hypothetical protein [Burkholderia multivorans]MBU9234763.1 hypothetical protein [Burkholderia multivorans]QGR89763.1 hypothetical protein FOC30_02075 [Burkholderia multivorans]HEF4738071.1 hypothetical protein [Burkholderia multivorans]